MATIQTNPKAFSKALKGSVKSAMPHTLTSMVKTSKKLAPIQISKDMTLRSKGFISSTIRYQRARSGFLQSEYGMIAKGSFTGLAEQEFGRTDSSKRAPTLKSRAGGNLARRVSPRRRLKDATKVAKASDFKRKPKSDVEMLAVWRSVRYKGLFMVPASNMMKPGIYRFRSFGKNAKLEMVHALGEIPQQRKRPWMDNTNERVMKQDVGQKRWNRSMTKFLADRTRRLTK
jgi:hypothetical protein